MVYVNPPGSFAVGAAEVVVGVLAFAERLLMVVGKRTSRIRERHAERLLIVVGKRTSRIRERHATMPRF
jgi:hypothetical protein